MSTKPASVEKIDVTLIRRGVGREEFRLPEGATLSTLLQEAGTRLEESLITIDGIPLAELVALQPGMIVTIAPRSETSPWMIVGARRSACFTATRPSRKWLRQSRPTGRPKKIGRDRPRYSA